MTPTCGARISRGTRLARRTRREEGTRETAVLWRPRSTCCVAAVVTEEKYLWPGRTRQNPSCSQGLVLWVDNAGGLAPGEARKARKRLPCSGERGRRTCDRQNPAKPRLLTMSRLVGRQCRNTGTRRWRGRYDDSREPGEPVVTSEETDQTKMLKLCRSLLPALAYPVTSPVASPVASQLLHQRGARDEYVAMPWLSQMEISECGPDRPALRTGG